MMELKNTIMSLCDASLDNAAEIAGNMLSEYTQVSRSKLGNIFGMIPGNTNYTILLDAHIDEIHFVVTAIDENGFVKVSKCGGVDIRVLSGSEVTVWGAEPLYGVFCALPPHLKKDKDGLAAPLDELAIDIGFDQKKAKARVKPGDRVTFRQSPKALLGDTITGKSLDDRTGVAALLSVADRIRNSGQPPFCNIAFQFSEYEEIGGMGAKTGSFSLAPDEAIAVDVSFGDNIGVADENCKPLGKGPLIGISPVLSPDITNRLCTIAEKNNITFQTEVMPGRTFTNADNILTSLAGIPCGLVSIPLRSMHTAVELISLCDVEATAELIYQYIVGGGISK